MLLSGSRSSLNHEMRALALPVRSYWRLRRTLTLPPDIVLGSRLPIGLGLAVAAAAAIQLSPLGGALQAGLASLELDPARAALIAGWTFCFVAGVLAGALTGRPWPSALAGIAYMCMTYLVPWAWHMATVPPVLFGAPQRLNAIALAHNLSTLAALAAVLAVVAAATGRVLADLVSAPPQLPVPPPALRALLLSAFAGAVALSALGVEPLLRYGPGHQVYLPAARGAAGATGQVLVRTVHSTALGADRPLAIYLPPSYRLSPNLRYSVVYLLHGSPGGYRDWLNLGIAGISDAGVASGSLAEAIIVMPDGNGRLNRPTQWADSGDGAERMESSLVELVSQVDREYRTLADRRHRVVAGLSEGGFGAVNLASRHPDLFGAAISLSGYFKAEGVVFGGSQALMRANSPSSTVRERPAARGVRFLLVAGESDAHYLGSAEAFAAELDTLGVSHHLFRVAGGHESVVWTNGLVLGLMQLKPQLEGRVR